MSRRHRDQQPAAAEAMAIAKALGEGWSPRVDERGGYYWPSAITADGRRSVERVLDGDDYLAMVVLSRSRGMGFVGVGKAPKAALLAAENDVRACFGALKLNEAKGIE